MSCSASIIITSRRSSTITRIATATRLTLISTSTIWKSWSPATKFASRGARRTIPAGSERAIVGRDRRGVRLVDEPTRHHLSATAQYSRKLGHRSQRAGDGVRQYGRELGDRRRL